MQGRSLTRTEREIVNLKKAELIDQDQPKFARLIEQTKDNDADFERRHLDVLNFVSEEGEDTPKREEAVSDEHSIE